MKRGREDGGPGGPHKRAAGDQYGDERQGRLTTSDALSYLREVKTRFTNNRKVYDSFLEIMKQFKAQSIDTTGVIAKVKNLFHGHPELILGFNTFLPKGYEIRLDEVEQPKWQAPPKAPVEFDQAINYVNKIKQRFASDERVYKAFLEILNMYRKGQKTIANVYDEVALLFRNHTDLLQEFTYFLPDNSPPAAQPRRLPAARTDAFAKRTGAYGAAKGGTRRAAPPLRRDDPKIQREVAFFDKVRQRLRNRDAYEDFLKCLNLFAEDVVTKAELITLVADLIGGQHDLVAGLNEFLMRCELGPEDPYGRSYQARGDRSRHANQQQKYISLPISELDVGQWERTTPSYVMLPEGYPALKTTGRSPLGLALLNDSWVSVTSGSEDFNFKHYRKNQYEEFCFIAEDDHFELDMMVDQNSSAIRAMQPLAAHLETLSEEARSAWVLPPGALRAFHYRAVARIYAEAGQQVVTLLRQNPAAVIPTVLPRLIQKDQEWAQTKAEMMPKWQAIFKENYAKSLDHRSFYFKQNEKKGLMPKTLVQELRDAADRRRSERVAVMLALTGRCQFSQRLCPHLSLDYDDVGVHADTSAVLQMGIDNMLAPDTAAKVRTMYHAFLETFFELRCACGEAEERRRASAARSAADGQPLSPRTAMRRAQKKAAAALPAPRGEEDGEANPLANLMAAAGEQGTEGESSDSDGEEEAPLAGVEAVAEEGEEEADESKFLSCRPVVPVVAGGPPPGSIPAPTVSPGPDGILHPHCRVFYGNESLYVLFRLHHILYDRMRAVRVCAATRAAEADGSEPPSAGAPVAQLTPQASAIHSQFLSMVEALTLAITDPAVYEDECRALLGTAAYQLFSVDKLVQKIVKQAQACLADESATRLVDLWRYENARAVPIVDAVYHANAHVVLGDEACYRFEHTAARRVEVQLMDPDKADPSPPILEPAFREYVAEFVHSEGPRAAPGLVSARAAEDAAARVCLRRNIAKVSGGAPLEEAAQAALAAAAMVNGLECKLGSSAAQRVKKIAYVLGTEDFFHKRKTGGPVAMEGVVEARAAKFRTWIDTVAAAPQA